MNSGGIDLERQRTPKELNELGDKAFYGRGQERNIEVAYTYYKQAADMNNPVGVFNLAKYYYQKAAYKQAFDFYKKCADLSYGPALVRLYQMYLHGVGVRRSKKKAFKYLKTGADLHDVVTYHLLAKMYEEGLGTPKNDSLANKYYELSATKNQVDGMYAYGVFLLKKKDKDKVYETAFYWLDKAANQHDELSIKYLVDLYKKPHPFLKKKSQLYLNEMTFHYQELLAKTKNVEALRLVAKAYEEGRDYLNINYQKAFSYYQLLHELDDIHGYLGLGKAYLYGLSVEKNYEKAIDYLEIASSRNVYEAKNLLGDIYRHGYGVLADYQKAKSHYLGAAEAGDTNALINLSLLHYRGQIKNASNSQALIYIKRATEKEVPKAFFWLGLYYELGVGVDKDLEKSIDSYKKAIRLGNHAARYKLANILFKENKKQKRSKRKLDATYLEIRDLLFTYIDNVDEDNRLKAIYMLGDLYLEEDFKDRSKKVSRYYYEVAAHLGYSKAMNRMYEIYHDEDIHEAIDWLFKAVEQPLDGEAYYKLYLCYLKGEGPLAKDIKKADDYLKLSANMRYSKALEKLTLQGE